MQLDHLETNPYLDTKDDFIKGSDLKIDIFEIGLNCCKKFGEYDELPSGEDFNLKENHFSYIDQHARLRLKFCLRTKEIGNKIRDYVERLYFDFIDKVTKIFDCELSNRAYYHHHFKTRN